MAGRPYVFFFCEQEKEDKRVMVYLDLVFRRMLVFMKAIFVYIVVNILIRLKEKIRKKECKTILFDL
jgi:hypothetical protein